MNGLRIGDFLLRSKILGISHVGVWVGDGAVFHNAPDRGEHVSSLADFAQGQPLRVEPKNTDATIVVARVRSKLVRPQSYDLVTNNCEHSANAVVSGFAFSNQLRVAAFVAAAGVLYLILRKR